MMESFKKVIDEFDDDRLDDTRNIESIMDFDISDVMSRSDGKIRDRLNYPATQSSDNSSVTNISENNIPELMILKNVDNKSNDDINNSANNFKYLPYQMSVENGNLNRDLKHEESLCTQCKADTELSKFNGSGKDVFLRAETDLLNDEIRISGSENVSNIMNQMIDVLGSLDKVTETENPTHCHLSSNLLFTPSDQHPTFTYNSMSESTPKKRSSAQILSRLEISPKDLFKCFADGGNSKIGSGEFEKKRFPRKRSLPKFDGNCTIHVTCDLFCQSQETQCSHFNRSKSEENIVAIKRKRVNNTCKRIKPIILSSDLLMQTDRNVDQTFNSSQAQQSVELIKYDSKNAPIIISMLSRVSSAGDELEQIQSIGNRFVMNDEELNHIETLNSGTSCALRNEVIALSRCNNTEIVGLENKIGSIIIPSTVEEVCYMNLKEKSIDVVSETSIMNKSKETQSLKHIISVHPIEDPAKDINLAQKGESHRKDIDLIDTSNSFLELSVESELDKIENEGTIYKEEKNICVDKISDIESLITRAENSSKVNTEIRIRPVDLSVAQRNSFRIEDSEKTDTEAENVEPMNAPSNFDAQFPSDTKFENIYKREDEKIGLGSIDFNNFITNPIILNIASTNNSKISNENIKCPADDFSSPLLSESQLEKIEREAFIKAKECKIAIKKKVTSIVNQEDIFYKPDNVNSIPKEHCDTLPIPNWVTTPAPEPDYNKMRHTNRIQRECIRKMLDEILRLSTIITKIGKIINQKPQKNSFQLGSQSSLQIPDSHSVPCVKKNLQIGPADSETFAKVNMNVVCSNNLAKKNEKNDIFYMPESSKSSYNTPPVFTNVLNSQPVDFGAPSTNAEMLDAKLHHDLTRKLTEKDKFYVPTIGISKYDSPVIFDDQNTMNDGTGNVFSDYNTKFTDHGKDFPYYSTSTIFNSLKNNSSDFGSHTSVARRIWYNEEDKENEIRKKRFESTDISKNNIKFQNFNILVTHEEDTNVIRSIGKIKDNAKPVINIFYSPEKPSSLSSVSNNTFIKNNFTQLLCTKNVPDVSSHNNFTTQSSLCHIGPNESRRQNLERNFTSLEARCTNDNGLFYNGNVE